MAEEDKTEQGGQDVAEERKGKPMAMVLLLFGVVAVAGGGGFAAAQFMGGPAAAEAEEFAEDNDAGIDDVGYEYIPFEPVTVNLNEDNSTRYLRTTLVLAIKKDSRNDIGKITKTITEGQPMLINALTVYLSEQTLTDVRGKQGLNKIRRAIQDEFNDKLWGDARPRMDHVLLKEFKVQ